MNVLFLTVGDKNLASSRVRVYSHLPFLREKGVKCAVLSYTASWRQDAIISGRDQNLLIRMAGRAYSISILVCSLLLSPFFDIIFLQKIALSRFSVFLLSLLGGEMIYDYDDAVFLDKAIDHILIKASCVLVPNDDLSGHSKRYNENVYVIPSPVRAGQRKDRGNYNADRVTIGWLGSPATSGYIAGIGNVLKEVKKAHKNVDIRIMGADRIVCMDIMGVAAIEDWSIEGEEEFLNSIDIGLMPLSDDPVSRAKAGYKLLRYMGKGIPGVASPVGINTQIVKDGANGFLADTDKEWVKKIGILIRNNGLRGKMGMMALETTRVKYSYDVLSPKLLGILESL